MVEGEGRLLGRHCDSVSKYSKPCELLAAFSAANSRRATLPLAYYAAGFHRSDVFASGKRLRSPLWSAHEEQTHRSLGNPRTTGINPDASLPVVIEHPTSRRKPSATSPEAATSYHLVFRHLLCSVPSAPILASLLYLVVVCLAPSRTLHSAQLPTPEKFKEINIEVKSLGVKLGFASLRGAELLCLGQDSDLAKLEKTMEPVVTETGGTVGENH
ncbi:hypothetical protein LXL04_015283 [Taraxacum kok-saghyz]